MIAQARMRLSRLHPFARVGGAVGVFFAFKVLVGLLLVAASARFLSVAGFAVFSQLFLFLALITTVAAGGVQHGLVRQIAAAHGEPRASRTAVRAALMIWAAVACLIFTAAFLARGWISWVLVGGDTVAAAIPVVVGLALTTGVNQIFCATLTGYGRAPTSLFLQGMGLAVGGALSITLLMRGEAALAVVAYAAGPAVTALGGLALTKGEVFLPRTELNPVPPEIRRLLGFSIAYLLTAALTPLTLFMLRHFFRQAFGVEELGYWLAANRISDVTTQLLGLFMAQAFLPAMARATSRRQGLRLAFYSWLIGTGVMLTGLLIFASDPSLWVRIFLSGRFLPAIPFIIGYMVGDVARVSGSIALHTALARGRLRLYVAIEACTATLIGLFALTGIAMGYEAAGYLAYPAAYILVALASWAIVWRLARGARGEADAIVPVQGSEAG
jgi:O-antigen/teichoic acid export membrane protein